MASILFSNQIYGELTISPDVHPAVIGEGGRVFSHMIVHLKVTTHANPPNSGSPKAIEFLSGTVFMGADQRFVIARLCMDTPQKIMITPNGYSIGLQLLADLETTKLEYIEKQRNGGDPQFRLRTYWRDVGSQEFSNAVDLDFRVAASDWTNWVLSKIEYGSSWNIVIEAPILSERFAAVLHNIKSAETHFCAGHYREVFDSCRVAIELFMQANGITGRNDNADLTQNAVERLLADHLPPSNVRKLRDIVPACYRYLHLGPHGNLEPGEEKEGAAFEREDAILALRLSTSLLAFLQDSQKRTNG
jgi:hypothetical protein